MSACYLGRDLVVSQAQAAHALAHVVQPGLEPFAPCRNRHAPCRHSGSAAAWVIAWGDCVPCRVRLVSHVAVSCLSRPALRASAAETTLWMPRRARKGLY